MHYWRPIQVCFLAASERHCRSSWTRSETAERYFPECPTGCQRLASWSIELRNPERLPSSLVGRVEDRHPDTQQNEGPGRRIKLVRDFAEHFDVVVCSKDLIYMYRYERDTLSEGEYLGGHSYPLFLGEFSALVTTSDLEHLGPRLNGTATI